MCDNCSKFSAIKSGSRAGNTSLSIHQENILNMSSRWTLVFYIWLLLIGQSLMDSGDASGDWDDSDITDASKLGQRNKTTNLALHNITRNASDFHYIARDDHEVIHNLIREKKRKSRKLGAKFCWVSRIARYHLLFLNCINFNIYMQWIVQPFLKCSSQTSDITTGGNQVLGENLKQYILYFHFEYSFRK